MGRRTLYGVADGTLSSLVSRNGDVGGYWGVGVLCRFALEHGVQSVDLDLLQRRVVPPSESFGGLMDRARQRLRDHLNALKLGEACVTAARIRISFEATSRGHTASTRFTCTVTIVDERGSVFERSATGWCWPHDPARESRRIALD